jgi:hypothetical protein
MGMSPAEVIEILGKPDQIAYLDGKVLVTVTNPDEVDFSQYRVSFMYDNNAVQIWFQNGRVESMTKI